MGLETIRAGVEGLPEDLKHQVKPLFEQAEGLLVSGPGTISIGADVIGRILTSAQGSDPVKLVNGGIEVGRWPFSMTGTPVVKGGQLSLDLDGAGKIAKAAGKLDGLLTFIEHLNTAVVAAGQALASVTVTPEGISVTTRAAGS